MRSRFVALVFILASIDSTEHAVAGLLGMTSGSLTPRPLQVGSLGQNRMSVESTPDPGLCRFIWRPACNPMPFIQSGDSPTQSPNPSSPRIPNLPITVSLWGKAFGAGNHRLEQDVRRATISPPKVINTIDEPPGHHSACHLAPYARLGGFWGLLLTSPTFDACWFDLMAG